MGYNLGPQGRSFDDVFERVATGFTTSTVGAITTGTQATVTVTVNGVGLPTSGAIPSNNVWTELGVWTSVYIGALDIGAYVSAANTVTIVIQNNSGSTITPPASTVYGVIMGRINQRYTQPNTPGGTSG
jgi:hypothetical protein